jgi:hypothetical protein
MYAEYALSSNTHRAMDAITNTFCAVSNAAIDQLSSNSVDDTGRKCSGEWNMVKCRG